MTNKKKEFIRLIPEKYNDDPVYEEIQKHFEKVAQKLKVASQLLKDEYIEDATSRLYYAVFHAIGACLRWKHVDLSNHKHVYIINQYQQHFIETKIFSSYHMTLLIKIKTMRETADYGIHQKMELEEINQLFHEIESMIKEIRTFLERSINKKLS